MATLQEIETALRNADAAGDTEAAKTLANAYRAAQTRAAGATPNASATEGMSGTEKFLAGAGKGMSDLYQGGKQFLGFGNQAQIDEEKRLSRPLMDTGAGAVGNAVGTMAAAIPTVAIPGANTVLGASAIAGGLGAMQPVATGESRMTNAATSAALGGASQYGLGKVADFLAKRAGAAGEAMGALQSNNAARDATAQAARDAGYVIPPTQTNPNVINRALEGLAGKITTGQQSSIKNQKITNDLIRADFPTLPPDMPVSKEALAAVRQEAGKVYDSVKKAGYFISDNEYQAARQSLGRDYQALLKEFPEMANAEIGKLQDALNKKSMSAPAAVELIKDLRYKGHRNSANFADPEKAALGTAQLDAASAIEDLMARNLQKRGMGDLAQQFKDARVTIAKAHTAESVLNEQTGDFSAKGLAKILKKDKPLSGGMQKSAEFARAFPTAAQDITSSMPGVSPLDYAASLGAGALGSVTGNPMLMAAPLSRPLARSAILSSKYQGLLGAPSYSPGMATTLPPEVLKRLEKLGAGGLLGAAYANQQ